MILHFYKLPTSFEMTYGLHWFYAKKNQLDCTSTSSVDEELRVDNSKPLDISEVSKNVAALYHSGQLFSWSMENKTYFFDPTHGYCNCNALYNKLSIQSYNYLNQLRLKLDTYPRKLITVRCQCFDDIFYGGKNFLTVSDVEYGVRIKKYSSFPEGFNNVFYVKEIDLYNVGCRTHYLVCSLNVMNVKQVQPGVFEIGLCYEFIQDYHSYIMFRDIEKKLYGLNTLKFFSDLIHLTNSFFYEDQKYYYEHCVSLIKHWISKGLIPVNDLHHFIFFEKTNHRFNEGHRFYMKRSDFDLVFSKKKEEYKEKTKLRKDKKQSNLDVLRLDSLDNNNNNISDGNSDHNNDIA